MTQPPISVRVATPEDEPFLYALYGDTRAEEMQSWNWGDEQRKMFLELQFRAQRFHHRAYSPPAEDAIILLGERAIGRMLVQRDGTQIYVVDVALMRENAGSGFGSLLLRRLQSEAASAALPIHLQVLQSSRAVAFYERLGFTRLEDRGTHFLMEWLPAGGLPPRHRDRRSGS